MRKHKVYFARPISQYNNLQDRRDIEMLKNVGFEVIDPNSKFYEEAYKSRGMDVFLDLVSSCDGLVFRRFIDGTIPAGVAKEIERAQSEGKWVLELPTIKYKDVLSKEDTRNYLRLLGVR